MRTVTAVQRRRAIVRRHHLGGSAESPEAATRAVLALHASDPASVYLSVLARSGALTLADVSAAMYERRRLVRWMAMRRTLFVFDRDDVPMIQAAVSADVAAMLRRRLISRLQRSETDPAIEGDVGAWLAGVEDRVERALTRRGTATGTQLAADEPDLRTRIEARTRSEPTQRLTTSLLTIMSAEGRLVRGAATGPWTSRQHRWEPAANWFDAPLPVLDRQDAQRQLAARWLARFGPATVEDLQWWAGWNASTTRAVLHGLDLEELDLHGRPGLALRTDDAEASEDAEPVATLLPALDPTPMGYKHREWFLGVDPSPLFDRAGNIGPTVWWDGEIIGAWAMTPGGELRYEIVADRGADARDAVARSAARLHARLEAATFTPAIRAPAERALAEC